jgi:hypothetical protein
VDGDESGILAPERSPLSRQESMTYVMEPPASEEGLTACQKAGSWFGATILLGTLVAVIFVLVKAPPRYPMGVPQCRSGAALGVLAANANGSQRLVVWSGRGQAGSLYHEWLHALRCAACASRGKRHGSQSGCPSGLSFAWVPEQCRSAVCQ